MLGAIAARNARHALALEKSHSAFSANAGAVGDLCLRLISDVSDGSTTVTASTASTASTTSRTFTVLDERVEGPISIERKPVFAIVELAGSYVLLSWMSHRTFVGLDGRARRPSHPRNGRICRQYKVTPDDLIVTEKLSGVDINDKIRLNKVLLLGNKSETIIGRPLVEGASVVAAVEEQFLDGKVLVFKKRRRKNSRRLNGHRQPLTSLRVIDIDGM